MADLLPEIQYYEESEVTTPMKKKVLLFLLVLSVGVLALGCGKKEEAASSDIPEDTFVADEPEEEEAEERRKEVFEAVPRIREIEDRINAQGAEISKIIISDRVDRKAAMEELKSKMDALNTEKAFLLTDNGFELDYMDVHYSCPKCKDTGMLETGERCQCFGEITKEKIRLTIKPRKAVQ